MLTVEDGTGLSNADSLVSIDRTDAYAEAFGRTEWDSLTVLRKEIRLREASLFVTSGYVVTEKPLVDGQAFPFPIAVFGVPLAVERAVMEVATAPGLPAIFSPADNSPRVQSESKAIDGLKKSVTYFDAGTVDRFPVATRLLSALPYMKAVSGNGKGLSVGRLVRA